MLYSFTVYLAVFVCLMYVILILKVELHMMQLNSYFNSRYVKWLRDNIAKSIKNPDKIFPFLTGLVAFYFDNTLIYAVFIVTVLYCSYNIIRQKAKKELSFTNRAVRLYALSILLVFIVSAPFVILFEKIDIGLLILIILSQLAPIVMIVSNTLLMPVEKSINQSFINDAKSIIQSHKNLIKIGVTGSYGKTSVKHFLQKILAEKYNVLITPGSFNTTMGVVRTIREYLKPIHEVFIIEMGAKKIGDVKEICDITEPRYGILTAVGPQHLETFGSIENITKGKLEIVTNLSKDGIGFVNLDSPTLHDAKYSTASKIVTFGVNSNAQYKASNIRYGGIGMTFDVEKDGNFISSIETRLLGEHNVSNLLVCVAVALELEVELFKILKAIRTIEPVEHRLEVKKLPGNITIIDDAFNSNPVGSKMALDVLKRYEGGRKIIVTPGMIELGELEFQANFEFGKSIADSCDLAFLVGEARTLAIQNGIKSTNFDSSKMLVCRNLFEANKKLKQILQSGDVILYENDLPDTFNE